VGAAAPRLVSEPELESARAGFRRFVDEVVAPDADEFDRREELPRSVLRAVAEQGYWGAVVPSSAGGAGMDMVTLGELHEEIGRGCSSLRNFLTVHTMTSAMLHRWGSEEAKRHWLPGLASGDLLGAFCLTEPEAGSDAAAGTAAAKRTGDGYRIDGTKRWITAGEVADVLLVFANTERGRSAFVVESANPGVERIPIRGMLGSRASMLAELRFTDCRMPAHALLGREGAGAMIATSALDLGRYSVASGSVGIGQACLEACIDYTSRRRQGGELLRNHQLVRRMMSDMVTRTRAARLLCRHAGELKDSGDPATMTATWIAKYFASTSAMRCAADAVQLHGANGCSNDFAVSRYFRDAKIMEIIEGSTEIQQLMIADSAYHGTDPLLADPRGRRA
jgi:alkylation response protein AidB-like acyl-CoA dehydrogenase